jgi:HlyD family secretion protein
VGVSELPRPVLFALGLTLIALITWYFWPRDKEEHWLGYVEAETLYIAAPVSGRLATRAVERGERVNPGAALFSLDPETADANAARLQALVTSAEAEATNLSQASQRPAELDVSRASEAAAAAQLAKAQSDFQRVAALAAQGFASRAQLDAARAARDGAQAALAQTRAQIRSGELTAGRTAQIASAKANVASAAEALRAQRKVRADIAPTSPAKGLVEQTFYNPGEWVPADSPVVSVLPDDRRKLRFYVPEGKVAILKPGTPIQYHCDGCAAGQTARISYISPRPEYTPPVIYSERARAKLVFLVEAMLPPSDKPLPPGLPVEVLPQ